MKPKPSSSEEQRKPINLPGKMKWGAVVAAWAMLGVLLTSSCGHSTHATPTEISVKPVMEPQANLKTFTKGHTVTILQKDGAIMSLVVSKLAGDRIIGTDALGREVTVALEDVRLANVTESASNKVATSILGVFAKTGEAAGKVAVYGLVYPLGALASARSLASGSGSYGSGSYGSMSCGSGSAGGMSCGSGSGGGMSCGSGSGGGMSCGSSSAGSGSGGSQ